MLRKVTEGSVSVPVRRIGDGHGDADTDFVVVEEPLEIRLDCTTREGRRQPTIAITMRTPGDDFDLDNAVNKLIGHRWRLGPCRYGIRASSSVAARASS